MNDKTLLGEQGLVVEVTIYGNFLMV